MLEEKLNSWSTTELQFKESFRSHTKANHLLENKEVESSRLLLLFYASECYLKAEYLKQEKLPNWNLVKLSPKELGHNLEKIVERIKLNNFSTVSISSNDEIGKYQEFLKYGNYELLDIAQRNRFNKYLSDIVKSAEEKSGYSV